MPAFASQTLGRRPFNGLIDLWNKAYSLQVCIVRNNHAVTVSITQDNMVNLPVAIVSGKAQLTTAATINTINALILEADDSIVNLATVTDSAVKALCLVRGPAIMREGAIRLLDAAGAAITLATVKTALLAVSPPILTTVQATNTVTQST
jgi:hypothetical protein